MPKGVEVQVLSWAPDIRRLLAKEKVAVYGRLVSVG